MKKLYTLFSVLATIICVGQEPIITTIVDGDCTGGNPKLIEIYANGTVDFSLYTMQNQTNANTTWGNNQDLSSFGTVTDDFIYITTSGSATALATEFPSLASETILESGVASINGDDRVRIILTDDSSVVDQFGASDTDGSGQPWEYTDSYAKRIDGTTASGGFVQMDWSFPGSGTLNGLGLCQSGSDTFETLIGGIGTYSTTPSTTPAITASSSVSGLFYFEGNPPSSEETFTVSGINLTSDIVITAPTNFEISLTTGSGFTNSITLTQAGGTVASTSIYVRLISGLTANTYTGDATVASTGATSQTVSLNGTVSPADPLINLSGSIADLQYTIGNGPSTDDDFLVEGMFLTDDIIVTAPVDFEVSLTSGSGFGSSVTIAQTGGTVVSTPVYVRMVAGLSLGSYTGNVLVSSTGATDRTESVNGLVLPQATCANVGDIILTEIMQNPTAAGDTDGEYFEVYNTTSSAISMEGWVIKDDATTTETHTILTNVSVPANGYAVFAINGDTGTNGGFTPNYVYGSDISLGNGTDGLIIECSGTTIDAVTWDNGATFPDPAGASMELMPDKLDSVSNDDGANWQEATQSFGSGDLGTPGSTNTSLSTLDFERNEIVINLYINANKELEIHGVDAASVQVFNVNGETIAQVNNGKINVSGLPTGVYIAKILDSEGNIFTKKFIKK